MFIDHLGLTITPDLIWPRIIGRLAFPIFIYLVVQGTEATKNPEGYYLRLLKWAAISQVPYMYFFGKMEINVLFTLAMCMLFVTTLIRRQYIEGLFVVIMTAVISPAMGLYGVLLAGGYWLLKEKPGQCLILLELITLEYCFITGLYLQVLAVLGFIMVLYFPKYETEYRLPRSFYYAFYPLHFLVISFSTSFLHLQQMP